MRLVSNPALQPGALFATLTLAASHQEDVPLRAARWHGRNDVRVEDIPEPPTPPPGQVQVQVAWCGICGTDLHELTAGPLYIPVDAPHPLTGVVAPVVLGHEVAGRVIAVGEGVEGLTVGYRVAACPIIGCGECASCRSGAMGQCDRVAFLGHSWSSGGFAERANLFAYQCYRLPDGVTDAAGALVEPFSATLKAVSRGEIGPGKKVAIVGAGPIGLLALQAAVIAGAASVVSVEVVAHRREVALRCGASATLDPSAGDPAEQAAALTRGEGFDVVLECVGREATALLAAKLTRTLGRLVVMGVFARPALFDYEDLVYKEKTVVGSMGGYGMYERAIEMMADPRFRGEAIVTGRIALEDIGERGFRPLLGGDGASTAERQHVKILVSPSGRVV